jgi:hypothetical protein
VYKLITNIANAGNTMVQAPKLSFPKEPSPTLPLLTVAFLFHLDALLLFIIKTQLLKWFNLPNGKYSEVVHAIIPIPYDGVDCHVGITRVIEEAGHIAVPHGVDAEFTGSGSGGAHVFIFAEKVQVEEVCDSLKSTTIQGITFRSYSSPRRSASASVMTSPMY